MLLHVSSALSLFSSVIYLFLSQPGKCADRLNRYCPYINQTSWLVVDIHTAPALSAAMISSLSAISPPAMTGVLLCVQILAMIFGMTPGSTSIISG